MNSRKNLIIGAIILVAVVLIGWLVLRNGESVDNTGGVSPSPTPKVTLHPSPTASPTPKATLHTVHLTSQGVAPQTLTIRHGDAVTFTNDTTTPYHLISSCSGLDSSRTLGINESYTLTFALVRTCTYYNQLDAANSYSQGTIIVQ